MEPATTDTGMHVHRRRAVWVMLVAVVLFSMMDAGLKTLSERYPPFQVAALRGMASLPLVLAWSLATVGWKPLLRVRWPLHLLRGVIGIAMMASFVYALKRMPLSTAYTIFFVAPLLITAMSVPFLGEHVGPRRWTAIAIGLLGVLVVLRPTGEGMVSLAGLAVLLAAFGYAVSAITVRVLARSDSNQAMAARVCSKRRSRTWRAKSEAGAEEAASWDSRPDSISRLLSSCPRIRSVARSGSSNRAK